MADDHENRADDDLARMLRDAFSRAVEDGEPTVVAGHPRNVVIKPWPEEADEAADGGAVSNRPKDLAGSSSAAAADSSAATNSVGIDIDHIRDEIERFEEEMDRIPTIEGAGSSADDDSDEADGDSVDLAPAAWEWETEDGAFRKITRTLRYSYVWTHNSRFKMWPEPLDRRSDWIEWSRDLLEERIEEILDQAIACSECGDDRERLKKWVSLWCRNHGHGFYIIENLSLMRKRLERAATAGDTES